MSTFGELLSCLEEMKAKHGGQTLVQGRVWGVSMDIESFEYTTAADGDFRLILAMRVRDEEVEREGEDCKENEGGEGECKEDEEYKEDEENVEAPNISVDSLLELFYFFRTKFDPISRVYISDVDATFLEEDLFVEYDDIVGSIVISS